MHAMIADEDKIGTEPAVRQTENLLRPSELTSYGVEWTTSTRATPLGGLAYFGHFLHANGLFDRLVAGCPLQYTSNNAPRKHWGRICNYASHAPSVQADHSFIA